MEDFYEYAKVEGVGELAGWQHHKSIEESNIILELFIQGKTNFAIVEKISNKVIGSIEIQKYKEELAGEKYKNLRCREIGYVLGKDYWGRGYMPEAIETILKYLFEVLELDAVFCGYFKRNTQSRRVNEKSGFKYLCDQSINTRCGTVEDSVYTVISREDWERI